MSPYYTFVTAVLSPLVGAMLAGLFGRKLGRVLSHRITIMGVAVSLALSVYIYYQQVTGAWEAMNITAYVWTWAGDTSFQVGFLVDKLTMLMMVVVTFVSLCVHVYTIGYMEEDDGYQRFFSYISLFTFAMLMLVMANNFVQLFFGWEAVGVVSYLLIGFWYKRESAIFANMKAFLVNRVGDFGFLLGISAVYLYFGSLDYDTVFAKVPELMQANPSFDLLPGFTVTAISFICICLFIGAMGKSAQMPLHVWLPDSMEGPTPISALIHAATMVTAGVFMVARMSPLFEYSEAARTMILFLGASTTLFMGLLGLVMTDIKRVIAYSTLSQLGYMMTAMGVSAYSVGIFHLMTHAFFKALLFLAAGSVIIAMHHEQDMRKMGGLRKYMPITYFTTLIGSVALAGIPPFAGFYSKDMIIEAVSESTLWGSSFATFAVTVSVFVTAFYSFRLFFWVFHTEERMDEKTRSHLHETPWVVWGPLAVLAVPSVIIGALTVKPLLFAETPFLSDAIHVLSNQDPLVKLGEHFHGPMAMALHAVQTLPFWLAVSGILAAYLCYVVWPQVPAMVATRLSWLHKCLLNKYGFDDFNQRVFAAGTRCIGSGLWRAGDVKLIDGLAVNGTARLIGVFSRLLRPVQSGVLYWYALVMILGLIASISWLVFSVN